MRAALSTGTEAHRNHRAPSPHIFRRTFSCGHPDEYIEQLFLDEGDKIHNLVTLEAIKEHNPAGDLPTNVVARCLKCAREAKDKDDKDPDVQPKRTLGAYQSGTSSTYRMQVSDAFEGTLNRYKLPDGKNKIADLHARVSEDEHHAHRQKILEEAVGHSGMWLAVPIRRVTNIPIRTFRAVDIQTPQESSSCSRHAHYKMPALIRTEKDKAGVKDDGSQDLPKDYALSSAPFGSETEGVKRMHETVALEVMKCHVDSVEGTLGKIISKREEERLLLAAKNTSSLSGSRLILQRQLSYDATPDSHNSDALPSSDKVETCLLDEDPISSGLNCASTVHSINQPSINSPGLPPGQTHYENPRPTPVASKVRRLSFRKRRSGTTTILSTHSEPGSRNYRKLSLSVVHSAKSLHKRESVSDSPDWACQTSLAVEAGRISMDSVGIQMRQETGGEERREAQSPPLVKHTSLISSAERHSEEALQALRTARAARLAGLLEGMEITLKQEQSMRHRTQVVSPVDLNKSLPPLPPPGSKRDWI